MIPRSAPLGALACAVLLLSFFASNVDAGYCGPSFDLRAARTRWAKLRQSQPSAEDQNQICRLYGNQFYEAVEARRAVAECEGAGEHQKEIEILDAEIEAFNTLIAVRCRT